MGKAARSVLTFFWSMQPLSIHSVGERPCARTKDAAHLRNAAVFAAPSSCHEWLTNASTSPRTAGDARRPSPESSDESKSWSPKCSRDTIMKRSCASCSAHCRSPCPTIAAMSAAAHRWSSPRNRRAWKRRLHAAVVKAPARRKKAASTACAARRGSEGEGAIGKVAISSPRDTATMAPSASSRPRRTPHSRLRARRAGSRELLAKATRKSMQMPPTWSAT
mmetsp:Transcript_16646/g.46243  ORF Transcript_16646/g.46243 Transcript_16646/m.46243 type:complete len:221 (-) Transcript_16646:1248-1910(-)|eukprot:scaffold187351_cov30-Tisochrysis_lutea.AAC.2